MQATEGKWKVDNHPKDDKAAWAAEGDRSSEPAEKEDADIALPEAPAPKAKKVARASAKAAKAADAEMSFEPVNLKKPEPKPQPKPQPKIAAKKPAPAPAPRPVAVARRPAPPPTGDNFEEDEYLDELLGEGPSKKKAAEPVKSSEITMDAEDLGDPDARERERDLARARAAGEAAVARMKAKLAKQGLKTYDRGPVPDAVAKPKKKVVVARVEPQDDVEDDDSADEDEDEAPVDDELDAVGDVVERPARKAEKAEKPEKRAAAPAPRPAAKKKNKGEFYASGEGFLAEDESGDESAPEVVSDDDDSDDDAEEARPAKKTKTKKAKKAKKKPRRAARSTKGKSRATSKGDRRKKSSDDDEG